MRIAFISQPYNNVDPPLLSNSVALWTYEVATRLARQYDVVIYARRNSMRGRFVYENVDYRYISTGIERRIRGLMSHLPKLSCISSCCSSTFYLKYILKIAGDIRRNAYDIVHIHNFSQFAPIVRRFHPGARIVLHMHCQWLTQSSPPLIARRLQSVDMILGSSESLTGKMRNAFPQFAALTHPLPNGVDINHFSRPAKKASGIHPLLVFICRTAPQSSLEVLLQAFKKVLEVIPAARLKIIDPDAGYPAKFFLGLTDEPLPERPRSLPNNNYLSRLCRLLDQTSIRQVSIAAFPPHHRLVELFTGATAMIHFGSTANQHESIRINAEAHAELAGVPVLEAMAAGIPVVATKTEAVSEIVDDGRTGFLVDHNNPDALANVLVKLIADDNLRTTIGKAAKKKATDFFSWESVTDKLLWYYQNIG